MPPRPQPVETGKEPDSWEGFTPGTREFPARLVRMATEQKWSRAAIAKKADVNTGTVSKWLNYKVAQPDRAPLARLEKAAGWAPNSLTADPEKGTTSGAANVLQQLKDWAGRMGLDQSVVGTFANQELGAAMQRFRPEIQRAVLGLVHVYGLSLEQATKHAARFVIDHSADVGAKHATPQWWFTQMADSRPRHQESGTHPSHGAIKTAKP